MRLDIRNSYPLVILLLSFLPLFLTLCDAAAEESSAAAGAVTAEQSSAASSEESVVDVEQLKSGLLKSYEGAKESLLDAKKSWEALGPEKERAAALAKEEMEKLFTIEYRVVDFEAEAPREAMELELQTLGKERWECSSLVSGEQQIRLICRRFPKSYLRLLLRGVRP